MHIITAQEEKQYGKIKCVQLQTQLANVEYMEERLKKKKKQTT